MLKNITKLWILSFLWVSLPSLAATCPRVQDLNFALPPAGWSYLISPISTTDNYIFHSAIHSLNAAFYYQQVICRYEACPSYLCPAFTLVSNGTYQKPNQAAGPWSYHSMIENTLTCTPGDRDPAHCVFQ